jgi:hypothetical protein
VNVPRKELLLDALRDAGRRGLTRAELRKRMGPKWGLLLAQLERDRHDIRRHPSRYRAGEWWRIELRYEAPVEADVAEAEPEQVALDVRGSAPPASALLADCEDAA